MEHDELNRLRRLLETTRVLSLGVLVDGEPEVGLLPYAVGVDMGVLYVQASGLARHARGLQAGARVSVLLHAPDAPDADPMQLTRLSVQATVQPLPRGTEAFAEAARSFITRFPTAAVTLQLDDFMLFELRLGRGRYIEGFARAFNVGPETFAEV